MKKSPAGMFRSTPPGRPLVPSMVTARSSKSKKRWKLGREAQSIAWNKSARRLTLPPSKHTGAKTKASCSTRGISVASRANGVSNLTAKGVRIWRIPPQLSDLRHTCITKLAESQASEQTLMAIAGHVSRSMIEHYSHIRMEAKRAALDAIAKPISEVGVAQNWAQSSWGAPLQ